MQVPMNFRLEGITGDEEKVVADLRELAVRSLSSSFAAASLFLTLFSSLQPQTPLPFSSPTSMY